MKMFEDIENEDDMKETQSVNSSIADISKIQDGSRGCLGAGDTLAQQKF